MGRNFFEFHSAEHLAIMKMNTHRGGLPGRELILRDLLPFVQFLKSENTHGGALLLVEFQAEG